MTREPTSAILLVPEAEPLACHGVYTWIYRATAFMPTTRIFKSGNSQAVRIPKELQFERIDIL